MAIQIQNYQAIGKGCLVSRYDVKLRTGLSLIGCAEFCKDGKSWVGVPQSAPFDGKDGVKRSIVAVKLDPKVKAAFEAAILSALKEHVASLPPEPTYEEFIAGDMPF